MAINHIEQSRESDTRLLFYPTGSRNRTSTRTKFVTEFASKSSEEVDFCRLNRPQTSMSLSVESRPKSASIRRSISLVTYLVVNRIIIVIVILCGACRRPYRPIYPRPPGSGHPGPGTRIRSTGPGTRIRSTRVRGWQCSELCISRPTTRVRAPGSGHLAHPLH